MTKSYDRPYVQSDAGALAGAIVLTPTAAVDRLPPLQAEPWPISEPAIEQHAILVRTLRDLAEPTYTRYPGEANSPTEPLIGDRVVMLAAGARSSPAPRSPSAGPRSRW